MEEIQKPITGYIGLVAILFCAFAPFLIPASCRLEGSILWDFRKLLGFSFVFISMALVELIYLKTYKRNFDFTKAKSPVYKNILRRFSALAFCFILIWLLFLVTESWFDGFIIFFYILGPLILIASPFYFLCIEKYSTFQKEEDELLLLGNWIFSLFTKTQKIGVNPSKSTSNLFRGIIVKAFFIPFMVTSCITFWNRWEMHLSSLLDNGIASSFTNSQSFSLLYNCAFDLVVISDITIATIGYITSCKFLDTHFKSVDNTSSGWLTAMICYPPLNIILRTYVWHYTSFECAKPLFESNRYIAIALAICILLLMSIYSWSTIVFGMRFSNLTNRGIICSGPYQLIRHPAYTFKNLSWWIALIACMISSSSFLPIQTLGLLVINTIYYFRAITEENHLMKDEYYREYSKKVPFRFIPGMV